MLAKSSKVFLVKTFTSMDNNYTTKESIILTKRSKCFYGYLDIQNPSIIAYFIKNWIVHRRFPKFNGQFTKVVGSLPKTLYFYLSITSMFCVLTVKFILHLINNNVTC